MGFGFSFLDGWVVNAFFHFHNGNNNVDNYKRHYRIDQPKDDIFSILLDGIVEVTANPKKECLENSPEQIQ